MKTTLKIQGETIELTKLLKASGLCATGGMAKIVTAQGRVTVDGHVELRKQCKIKKGQSVTFEGHEVQVL